MNPSNEQNTSKPSDVSRPPSGYLNQGGDFLTIRGQHTLRSFMVGSNINPIPPQPVVARPQSVGASFTSPPPALPQEKPPIPGNSIFSMPPPPIPSAIRPPLVPSVVMNPFVSPTMYQQHNSGMGPGRHIPSYSYQLQAPSGYLGAQSGYNNFMRKRNLQIDHDGDQINFMKKKKKPLSINRPAKKNWTLSDAQRAWSIDKQYNKSTKCQLIIKFPDFEINREMITNFHPKITSIHFQQPYSPRFCFVTLPDSCDMIEVIEKINKTKFGIGYLCAEPKNNQDEDTARGPEDIDPLTLYVGNFLLDVTVNDVHKMFPKHKRVDISFAKRMKFTKYAFVSFHSIDDAIEAFKTTHGKDMNCKTLIVRFRRLRGSVGLPGNSKAQNVRKRDVVESSTKDANGVLPLVDIKSEPVDYYDEDNTLYHDPIIETSTEGCPELKKEEDLLAWIQEDGDF